MNPFSPNSSPVPIPWVFLKTFLLLVAGIAGLMLIGRLFPLPKMQGLAYVAHPAFALGGVALAGLVYLLLGLLKSPGEGKAFWWGLGASLLWSLTVFTLLA